VSPIQTSTKSKDGRVLSLAITNDQSRIQLNRPLIHDLAHAIFRDESSCVCIELTVNFLTDDAITILNRQYHKTDSATDVLAFALERSSDKIVADIIVSTDTAARQAKDYKTSVRHEVYLYVIHGLLHICGYDDLKPGNRRVMRRMEKKYLKQFRIS
jgi:probable rRNA maturation factor